jgi:hypothetical protein
MQYPENSISLGFSRQTFAPGVHICQIYGSDEERQEVLLKFLSAGLQSGERSACFSEHADEGPLEEFLSTVGVSFSEAKGSGALTLSGVRDIYFQDARFDPERMLGRLRTFHAESRERGYRAARVIGDMLSEVNRVPGGSRLAEYESRVTLLLREHPITAVCQYDCREFDGGTIMDILKVHPLMVVRGSVFHNPFYVTPEGYLGIGKDAPDE